jgi:hypothetical protein
MWVLGSDSSAIGARQRHHRPAMHTTTDCHIRWQCLTPAAAQVSDRSKVNTLEQPLKCHKLASSHMMQPDSQITQPRHPFLLHNAPHLPLIESYQMQQAAFTHRKYSGPVHLHQHHPPQGMQAPPPLLLMGSIKKGSACISA